MIALKPHPLDNSLVDYIEAAEEAGLDWMISGGAQVGEYQVLLARGNEQDFCADKTDTRSIHVAFQAALKEAGVPS